MERIVLEIVVKIFRDSFLFTKRNFFERFTKIGDNRKAVNVIFVNIFLFNGERTYLKPKNVKVIYDSETFEV